MSSVSKLFISPESSIEDAIRVIDSDSRKIALVVGDYNKLFGTVTDGDLRQAMLEHIPLTNNVTEIMCSKPTTSKVGSSETVLQALAENTKHFQIPIVDDNFSILDLYVSYETFSQKISKPNKAIIIAGGLGSRLGVLTRDVPKPMLKLGDKPILQSIVERFADAGFFNITISINYRGQQIKDYFEDGSKFGVNIDYIHEDQKLGTAGPLSLLKEKPNEHFFVMNADLITDINFDHFLSYHYNNDSMATMGVRNFEMPVPYGVVDMNEGKIKSIKEKPIYNFFINSGIYVLSPKVLDYIPHNQYLDMPTLFKKLIKENMQTFSFPIRESWVDIGKVQDFEMAQEQFLNNN